MLVKAIVEEIINKYQVRVRVPIFHQIETSPFATPKEQLPIASICTIPGINLALKVGEVVYVDFEVDQRENPVVMGVLARENIISSSDADIRSLKVDVNCELPSELYLSKEDQQKLVNFEAVFNTDGEE